ncbi:probable beta-1,3-galactosyltransferase 2 [Tanacetum coccineum]
MYEKLLSGPNPPDLPILTTTIGATLAKHRVNPQVYIGCMKSGPVFAHKGVRYHETEHWKFREEGNKYFRYATGQLYAISKDLATYISINQNVLHMYVNEDVSLGSWFTGLDVEHIDDRKLCCGTPPDNQYLLMAGLYYSSVRWSMVLWLRLLRKTRVRQIPKETGIQFRVQNRMEQGCPTSALCHSSHGHSLLCRPKGTYLSILSTANQLTMAYCNYTMAYISAAR